MKRSGWKPYGISPATRDALALAMRPGARVDLLPGWQVRRLREAGYVENWQLNDAGREAWAKLSRGEAVA